MCLSFLHTIGFLPARLNATEYCPFICFEMLSFTRDLKFRICKYNSLLLKKSKKSADM